MPTISLTLPIAGTSITAGLHSANYSALQALLNAGLDSSNWATGKVFAPSKLTQESALAGQLLEWNGTSWVPASLQLDYVEYTANVTATATTEAAATVVATATPVVYDGATPIMVEFFAPAFTGLAGGTLTFVLYDGAASIGLLGRYITQGAGEAGAVYLKRRLTPAAATKTYSVRAFGAGSGAVVNAGGGGLGNFMPGYIRTVRAT